MEWKIGISSGAYKGISFDENVRLMAANGFHGTFTGYRDVATAEGWAKAFAAAGIAYETIHAPSNGINNIWHEGEAGDAALTMLSDAVEGAAAVGVPIVVIHLSSGNNAPPVTDAGRARWDKLIELAGQRGVVLGFENQRKLSNLAYIFEQYPDAPQVRFCWDCGHESCFTPGRQYMPLFGEKTACLHLHDNFADPRVETPDIHLLPFDGNNDLDRVARQIVASPFRGTLMLEVTSAKGEMYVGMSAEDYFARAAAAARRLGALCAAYEA